MGDHFAADLSNSSAEELPNRSEYPESPYRDMTSYHSLSSQSNGSQHSSSADAADTAADPIIILDFPGSSDSSTGASQVFDGNYGLLVAANTNATPKKRKAGIPTEIKEAYKQYLEATLIIHGQE